jgi:hypothetical protein
LYSGTGEYPTGWSWVETSWTTLMADLGHTEWTHNNEGVDGAGVGSVDTNISGHLSDHSPDYVYLHVGTNDIALWGTTLANYLSYVGSINTKCSGASAELIVNQILPRSDYTSTVKLWNAALEDWCRTNSVKMSPVYQDMASSSSATEDYLSSYALDSVHPDSAGYALMGSLMAHAAIPSRKRVWGASSYPDFSYVSWKWAVLSGSALVTEDADKGVVNLAQNETADLTVECLPTGNKTLNLSAVCRSGAVTIYYRTAATTNFARNAAAEWTQYTEAFATTDQFIQVRITNVSATPAVVRYAGMTWSGSALGAETDPEPITLTSGYSGTASWQ